ncbi:Zinc finger, CCHC-type [Corchorus olitorius]|uniref:Zinc finger, CCHC-type n=1 Tax=Corchorus olitorius TaxID=93759 RepID=A0A1R3K8Z6_9ROSI|nr:Zinc finger, CCHC-type [Corchorus olitorius]
MNRNFSRFPDNKSSSLAARPVCQICGRIGHLAKSCRKGKQFFSSSPRVNFATSSAVGSVQHWNQNSGITKNWCMDSGATDHTQQVLAQRMLIDGVYQLPVSILARSPTVLVSKRVSALDCHGRLGHPYRLIQLQPPPASSMQQAPQFPAPNVSVQPPESSSQVFPAVNSSPIFPAVIDSPDLPTASTDVAPSLPAAPHSAQSDTAADCSNSFMVGSAENIVLTSSTVGTAKGQVIQAFAGLNVIRVPVCYEQMSNGYVDIWQGKPSVEEFVHQEKKNLVLRSLPLNK